MTMPVNEAIRALTEKEKQTLRLIVRGHDAKSTARSLGLSVHTINERLRDARRKMAVSSSRQAARLLFEAEGEKPGSSTPDSFGDTEIGEDPSRIGVDQGNASIGGAGRAHRHPRTIIGVLFVTVILGLLALAALPQTGTAPTPSTLVSEPQPNAEVVEAARRFLMLVDEGRWDESYRATGTAFQALNTAEVWAAVSEKVRVPLGAVNSRVLLSQEYLPAPPDGYEVVKFRTRFVNKADAVETVTLDREGASWRVVGITIG